MVSSVLKIGERKNFFVKFFVASSKHFFRIRRNDCHLIREIAYSTRGCTHERAINDARGCAKVHGNLKFPEWHGIITLTQHNYPRNLGRVILRGVAISNGNESRQKDSGPTACKTTTEVARSTGRGWLVGRRETFLRIELHSLTN